MLRKGSRSAWLWESPRVPSERYEFRPCLCVFVARFDRRIFLLFVKNGFVVGVRCQGNSESLKECEYPHCASATRRLALDNRTYSAQLANSTHTRCRPTLSWMGGAVAEWLERREVGEGGREGREGGR